MTEAMRRAADRSALDIEAMIINETDAKQRAFLIVLNSINNSLIANTNITTDLSDKLETHLQNFAEHTREEEAIKNRGRGAWRVLAWVLSIGQILALGFLAQVRTEFKDISASIQSVQSTQTELKIRLDRIDRDR